MVDGPEKKQAHINTRRDWLLRIQRGEFTCRFYNSLLETAGVHLNGDSFEQVRDRVKGVLRAPEEYRGTEKEFASIEIEERFVLGKVSPSERRALMVELGYTGIPGEAAITYRVRPHRGLRRSA